jgi:peptidoglycan lytic transglycosylase
MPLLFAKFTSCFQVAAFEWRLSSLILMAALTLASQGCGIVSETPNRAVWTKGGISPSESQNGSTSTDKPQTNSFPSEIPPTAKVPPFPETEQSPPIAKIPAPSQSAMMEIGLASWYGSRHHGKRTASGEVFNQDKFTAAHRTLPWGSKVKVTNLANGNSVEVRINDRGPFAKGRIIDVSRAAARALGIVGQGITTVRIEWLLDSEKSNELVLQENRPSDSR